MAKLVIKQGAYNGWFLYKGNQLLLGSHDLELLKRIKAFLESENKTP